MKRYKKSMDRFSDLDALLDQALKRVQDPRKIWLQTSLGFDTRIEWSRGMILGGALSPHYLTKKHADDLRRDVPYTVWLERPRFLVCPDPRPAFKDWIPLLESLSKLSDALILVTPRMESDDLFATLLTNHVRNVIRCVVVSPGTGQPPDLQDLARRVDSLELRLAPKPPPRSYLAAGEVPVPQLLDQIPCAERVGIRRGCTVAIPYPGAEKSPALSDIAILRVGGEHVDDLQDRLVILDDQLRRLELNDAPARS